MEAKRLFEFLLGVARRSIVHHAEHVGDAERRIDETSTRTIGLVHRLQEIQGEAVVVVGKHALLLGQLQGLRVGHHIDDSLCAAVLVRRAREQHHAACCHRCHTIK